MLVDSELVMNIVLLRMAGIKHILGLHEEAISDYTALLNADSNYVPALKGTGENLFQNDFLCDLIIRSW